MNTPLCDCKEKSCPKDCSKQHTHKGFFCEQCEPVEPTPLRPVSEVVEEFRETFSVPKSSDNWTPDTYPHPLGIVNWLTTTLEADRTAQREEMVREIAQLTKPHNAFDEELAGWNAAISAAVAIPRKDDIITALTPTKTDNQ